jgi:hypothetical protein
MAEQHGLRKNFQASSKSSSRKNATFLVLRAFLRNSGRLQGICGHFAGRFCRKKMFQWLLWYLCAIALSEFKITCCK